MEYYIVRKDNLVWGAYDLETANRVAALVGGTVERYYGSVEN